MATDRTQLQQPVGAFRPVVPDLPEVPAKLLKMCPEFKAYHEELSRAYKSLASAARQSHEDLALPVAKTATTLTTTVNEALSTGTADLKRVTTELTSKIGVLQGQVTTVTETYATKDYASARKDEAISAAHTDAVGLITSSLVGYATETYAQTQATNAHNSAVADAVSAINTTLTTYATQTYADTKKTEAIASAHTDAASQITTALSTYATQAYATAKRDEAIASAHTDAASQISTSLTTYATKTYADTKKTEAITAAQADAASQISTALTAYATQAYADTKKSEAIAAAHTDAASQITTSLATYASQAYADARKTEAISAAKTYTDGQITSLADVYVTDAEAISIASTTVSAAVAGKISSSAGTSAPTTPNIGDLWIDTANGNALKRWSGSAWVDTQIASGAIGSGQGNRTFIQSTAPTGTLRDGDLWFDTANNGALKRYNGTAWVASTLATDASVTTVATSVATLQTTTNGYFANLESKYTLKVTAGNVVTGMNITSKSGAGTDVSDITFQATSFKVYNGTTGVTPFQVVGGQVRVTGSLVLSPSDVTGLGSLATSNSVDLSTTQVTNKSLANLDSTANAKLAGIAAGADVTLTALSGGVLAVGASGGLRSNNYVLGSAGWKIGGDGSCEFSNGTFRGVLNAGSGVYKTLIDTTGFYYGDTTGFHAAILRGSYAEGTRPSIGIRSADLSFHAGLSFATYPALCTQGELTLKTAYVSPAVTRTLTANSAGISSDEPTFSINGFRPVKFHSSSEVFNLSGGGTEELFSVSIAGKNFTTKPNAGVIQFASTIMDCPDMQVHYDYDNASNSSSVAYVRFFRSGGGTLPGGYRRISCIFTS